MKKNLMRSLLAMAVMMVLATACMGQHQGGNTDILAGVIYPPVVDSRGEIANSSGTESQGGVVYSSGTAQKVIKQNVFRMKNGQFVELYRVASAEVAELYLLTLTAMGNCRDAMYIGCEIADSTEGQWWQNRVACSQRMGNQLWVDNAFRLMEGGDTLWKYNRWMSVAVDASGLLTLQASGFDEKGSFEEQERQMLLFEQKVETVKSLPLSDTTALDQWQLLTEEAIGCYGEVYVEAVRSLFLRNPENFFRWIVRHPSEKLSSYVITEDNQWNQYVLNQASTLRDDYERGFVMGRMQSWITQ